MCNKAVIDGGLPSEPLFVVAFACEASLLFEQAF